MTRLILAACAALLIAAAPAAAASSPLVDGYAPPGSSEQGAVSPATSTGDTGAVKGELKTPKLTKDTTPTTATKTTVPTAPTATPTQASPSGTLPFTGLDVGLVAFAGALLVALGLVTRKFATRVDLDI